MGGRERSWEWRCEMRASSCFRDAQSKHTYPIISAPTVIRGEGGKGEGGENIVISSMVSIIHCVQAVSL